MIEPTATKDRATLYRKIAAVTAAVSRIPKNGENTFHRYKYATESDITDGLRDLLEQHGLAFLPPSVISWERDETIENPKLGPRTRVQVQFGIGCCDTGEVFTSVLWGEGQDTSDKGFYKAYTGAVKYFLMKTFLIATGDDPEQRDEQPQQRQAPQRPTAHPSAQPQRSAPQANGNGGAKRQLTQQELADAVRTLWAEEKRLGSVIPASEVATDLDSASRDQLIELGKKARARVLDREQQSRGMPEADLPADLATTA